MKNLRTAVLIKLMVLVVLCAGLSGCALFALPSQIIGGVFDLLGQALQVANGMPKPPPWLFF